MIFSPYVNPQSMNEEVSLGSSLFLESFPVSIVLKFLSEFANVCKFIVDNQILLWALSEMI